MNKTANEMVVRSDNIQQFLPEHMVRSLVTMLAEIDRIRTEMARRDLYAESDAPPGG